MKPKPLTHKLAAVRRVRSEMQANPHLSLRAACCAAGIALSSYQEWSKRLDEHGETGLAVQYANCGRRAKFELTASEKNALRGLVLLRDSVTFAVEEFARTHPDCRPEIRAAILEEMDTAARQRRYCRWPISMRRAATVTLEERRMLRGSKAFESISFSPRKGLFFVDANGNNIKLAPHAAWVMDDYSTNEPYEIEGGRLCRQVLASMDVFSDAWLSVEMIGRERDAYRAEDIVRFILRTIDSAGTMPLFLLLERGRWDSTGVHGLDLGCISPKYEGRAWGGLDDLFTIIHGYSSRHKAQLESSFSILQRALAHSGTEIGRHRGEFEKATKDFLAVQAGRKKALECGFLTQDQAREAHWQAMQQLNARGKHRAATGTVEIPSDLMSLWDEEEARPLPASERWRFLPCKRKATVRGGFIETSVAPYRQPFRFQINGLPSGIDLPTGYTLLIAFDPAMPAMGAYVCNGETDTKNRAGWGLGEYLMTAPGSDDVPMIDLRGGGYSESGKRLAGTAARTAFASIDPYRRRGLAVTQRHDGEGNAQVTRTGATHAEAGITSAGRPADPLDDALSDRTAPNTRSAPRASASASASARHLSTLSDSRADLERLEAEASEHLSML
jgi:hypothetical protein